MKRSILILATVMLALSLSGCFHGKDPQETQSSSVPGTTATTQPDETITEPPVFSCGLYTEGIFVYFVNPVTKLLTMADITASETYVLYEQQVWDEFFVIGNKIFFRELYNNRICSVLKTGGGFSAYLKMPFTTGVMSEGTMYFIDNTVYGSDTVLYKYSIYEGVWSTSVLSGNRNSLARKTLAFTGDRLYYTSSSGGYVGIMEYIYKTGEKKVVWPSNVNSPISIPEILYLEDSLFFKNPEGPGFISLNADNQASYINVSGTRIYGTLAGEFLISSQENTDILLRGNSDGQVSECEGGVVLVGDSSRALIMRADGAKDKIVLVKYPEDEEQYKLTGTMYKTLTCDGYALVFLRDRSNAVFIDFEQAAGTEVDVGLMSVSEIGIEQYLSEKLYNHTTPSSKELEAATPSVIAQVFAQAVAKSDRLTLNKLLPEESRLKPFEPIFLKSWKVSLSEGEVTVYNIEYTPYSEGDLAFRDYWPEIIKKGTLSFIQNDGIWKISVR